MIRLLRRLWYLLRPDRHERQLDDELRFHLEMERHELVSRGLDPDAATLATRRAMGNLPLTRNQVRDVWIAPWLQDVLQDVRYGLRTLRRHPGFAAQARQTSMCIWSAVSRPARRSTSPRPNSRTTSRATSRCFPCCCAA